MHLDPPWTVLRARAYDAVSGRRWGEAIQTLGEALVLAPRRELADLYALRAYVRLQLEEPSTAEDDATACLSDDPFHVEGRWWRGIARAHAQQWDESIDDLRRAASEPSSHGRAIREWLERVVTQAGEAWRRQVLQRTPTADDFVRRAQWALTIDDLSRAERDAAEAERLDPHCAGVWRVRSELARRRGAIQEALQGVDRWIELRADDPAAYRLRADLLIEIDASSQAIAAAEKVESLAGDSLADRLELVRFWRRIGDRLRALGWCDRCQTDQGNLYPVLELRGRLLMDLRCWRSAADQWRQLMRLRPDATSDRVQLGRCLVKLRRFDEATRVFEEGAILGPTAADVHAGLALSRWSARDSVGAKSAIERALRLDTTHLPSRVLLAHLEMSSGRVDGAIRMLHETWERAASDPTADDEWLGECAYAEGVGLLERGETEQALERFNAALLRRADHPGTLVWRAKAWARSGRFDRCRRDLANAARLHPICRAQYERLGQELAQDQLTTDRVRFDGDAADRRKSFQRIVACELAGNLDEARRSYALAAESHAASDVAAAADGSKGLDSGVPSAFEWEWRLLGLRLARGSAKGAEHVALRHVLRESLTVDQVLAVVDSLEESAWRGPALVWLETQAKRFPDSGRLAHQLGMAYHETRRPKRAARWFSTAISLGHVEARTLACCGHDLLQIGEADEADRRLTMSLERHANEPSWLAWRGEVRLKQDRYDEALADFELALTIDPGQVRAYCGRAMVMARRSEWEPALQWLTKAFHRFGSAEDRATLLHCRGRLFFNMKRFRRAIDDWDWAIAKTDDRHELGDLLFMRGVAWFHLGDMERMRHDLERTLIANTRHKGATVVLDWLDNRIERFPSQLAAPRRQVLPTRPASVSQTWEFPEPIQPEPEFPLDQWILRKGDGKEYGPVSRRTLLDWSRDGRVEPTDWLLRSDWNRWRRAAVVWNTLAREPKENSSVFAIGASTTSEEFPGPPSIEASTMSQVDVGVGEFGMTAPIPSPDALANTQVATFRVPISETGLGVRFRESLPARQETSNDSVQSDSVQSGPGKNDSVPSESPPSPPSS